MILRLDPAIPRVWRDPETLQFGIDRQLLVLRELSLGDERLIHALGSGVSRAALDLLAARSGAPVADVETLLARLSPVLARERNSPRTSTVSLVGAGGTALLIERSLAALGMIVHRLGAGSPDQPADFGIALGQHVLDPRLHRYWLRRDIPHLGVVLGESSARVGPIVEPGRTACLNCVERHAIDADPAWTAIATQLLARAAPPESPLVSLEAAALAVRAVVSHLDGGAGMRHIARIEAESGRVTRVAVPAHPSCGCLAPQGNDSDSAGPFDSVPAPPTTRRSSGARA